MNWRVCYSDKTIIHTHSRISKQHIAIPSTRWAEIYIYIYMSALTCYKLRWKSRWTGDFKMQYNFSDKLIKVCSRNTFHKLIKINEETNSTYHFSWANPKKWIIVHTSDLFIIIRQVKVCMYSLNHDRSSGLTYISKYALLYELFFLWSTNCVLLSDDNSLIPRCLWLLSFV